MDLGRFSVPLSIWQILDCLDPPIQLQVDRPGEGERRHESWPLSSPSPSLDSLETTPCPQVPLETLAALSAKGVGSGWRRGSEVSQGMSEERGKQGREGWRAPRVTPTTAHKDLLSSQIVDSQQELASSPEFDG